MDHVLTVHLVANVRGDRRVAHGVGGVDTLELHDVAGQQPVLAVHLDRRVARAVDGLDLEDVGARALNRPAVEIQRVLAGVVQVHGEVLLARRGAGAQSRTGRRRCRTGRRIRRRERCPCTAPCGPPRTGTLSGCSRRSRPPRRRRQRSRRRPCCRCQTGPADPGAAAYLVWSNSVDSDTGSEYLVSWECKSSRRATACPRRRPRGRTRRCSRGRRRQTRRHRRSDPTEE